MNILGPINLAALILFLAFFGPAMCRMLGNPS